jgi:hypothetical protein
MMEGVVLIVICYTISSHLISQSSDLHKWKSWGHKPFAYTIQWRQMRWIRKIRKAVTD